MKILVVNAGSSSLKFQMYEMPSEKVLISGIFEKIGSDSGFYSYKVNGEKTKKEAEMKKHTDAINCLIDELLANKVVEDLNEIKGVGHRVVHGGDKFATSVIVNDEVEKDIENFASLAPLHNPANLEGIRSFKEKIPNAIQVATFDTAFHQTLSPVEFLYPVPYEWYQEYKVRKYGFHGTSHKYVSDRLKELTGKEKGNFIVCHIGSGASITAIKNGVSADTSMGFTPNAGIMMGTRSGDIDYSMIPYIINETGKSVAEIDSILNKQSGYLGISGISNDQRDIFKEIELGNERCILSNEMFNKKIVEYIAKYYVFLQNVDGIAFTAGTGERSPETRRDVINLLKPLGLELDEQGNKAFAEEALITTAKSSVPVWVIPTDEEVIIARDTLELIS